jgi:hypothetical protein
VALQPLRQAREGGAVVTLVPVRSHLTRGVEGKPARLDETCAKPGCGKPAKERHHLFAKSYLRGQPYEWVSLPDGTVVANSVGLCTEHHQDVTGMPGGHQSWIALEESGFVWYDIDFVNGEWVERGPLGQHARVPGGERCPTCGHVTHEESKPLPKRKVKTWAALVPDDEEDGAEILDGYVEDFAVIFGLSGESARLRRYHVLARVLQWASVNRIDLIREWEETA